MDHDKMMKVLQAITPPPAQPAETADGTETQAAIAKWLAAGNSKAPLPLAAFSKQRDVKR